MAQTRALEWQRLILVGLPYKSGEKHDPHGRFWHQSTSKWPAFARREWDAQVAMTVLGILLPGQWNADAAKGTRGINTFDRLYFPVWESLGEPGRVDHERFLLPRRFTIG